MLPTTDVIPIPEYIFPKFVITHFTFVFILVEYVFKFIMNHSLIDI